ncbi:hypothetical protein DDZ13_13175 [Coraliomargarita sinensis]|uniref:Prenyltransferase n=1 Tax=Coraliomargarita sinensis TaxID=2174842 RepID=A0A317ZDL9_9BACT|nr:hypothetical protein [Coraliomargarita sinensis]PXA03170.1 hypothetical protein DDZ13_13175 [Coraliomargarita sinensis]
MTKIKCWQWPNLLAVDASVIAVAWLRVFAEEQNMGPGLGAYPVLALSVWLTYQSDRLFDAGPRQSSQLISARHRFAKRHYRVLWTVWGAVLVFNISLAFACLGQAQLFKGFILLLFCLTYTCLNHIYSKRFFPKELIVAAIFAGGSQVFLTETIQWASLLGFTLLCLINCLAISWKETSVDTRLKVQSISSILKPSWGFPLLASGIGVSFFSDCLTALLPSMLLLSLLQIKRKSFDQELFRVLCDSALLVGPLLYLFGSGVLVR